MRNILFFSLILFCSLVSFAKDNSLALAPASVDKSLRPLVLHLDYYPTTEFAGIFLAYERGWYRAAGLDLKIIFKDLNISENLLADEADIAMHSGHEVIRQVAMGHDVKAFAAELQINPLSLAAIPKIKTLRDLRGKTIGYFSEQEKDFIRVMFAHEGMTLEQVNFSKITLFGVDNLLSSLKNGSFDALPVWAFNHPVAFAQKGFITRQFQSYRYGFNFYGTVFYAKTHTIAERKTDLAKFIEVTRRGWQAAFQNPEATATHHLQKWYPKSEWINGDFETTKNQQITEMQLLRRYLYEGVGPAHFGEMTRVQWLAGIEIAQHGGLIQNTKVTPEDVYTDDVMKIVKRDPK
jgi:ABC-type nitrate/sulfonate/bicarbonate transport system substrate-binding protein